MRLSTGPIVWAYIAPLSLVHTGVEVEIDKKSTATFGRLRLRRQCGRAIIDHLHSWIKGNDKLVADGKNETQGNEMEEVMEEREME